METSKDPGKPMEILAIIFSILGIVLTLIGKIEFETFIVLVIATISAITFTFLSFYVKATKKNSEEIEEIKKNFKFEERLNKLENKVFKR